MHGAVKKALVIGIFVLFCFVLYTRNAFAITDIVTTSSTTGATQPSTMRHLVRTSETTLHAFVQMGTNTTKCGSGGLWWLYSTNSGTSWTCGGQLSSDTTNLMYADVRADSSDNLYLVYSVATTGRNDAYDVLYRKISYNGSSNWTLNSAQIVFDGSGSATGYHYSVLELQGTSRIWLASRYFDGTNYGVTAYYSDSLGIAPTWTVSQATMDTAGTNASYHYPTFARFSTNIGLIYNIESGSDMAWRYRADSDGLTSWNSQATISTNYLVRFPAFSAVGDTSGNIYFAASGSTTLFSYYSSGWQATPATVSSTAIPDQYISVATDGTDVWVVYGDATGVTGGVNKRVSYKKGVSPFATANFDTNPTLVASYHSIFNKVWLYDASANTYEDETTDAGDTGTADIAHSSSSTVVKDVGDIVYLGKSTTFDAGDWESSTVGTGAGALVWEYCSAIDASSVCTTWSTLTFTASLQTAMRASSGYGAFTPPSDWQAAKVNSESIAYFYIRGRTSVAFTVGPVGTQFFAVPPNSWASVASSTDGVFGIWTENSASVTKVRYSTIFTSSPNPYAPTSLGGHTTGATTSDNAPGFTFSLSDPGVSDTVKYRIQIDDTPNFSSPVVDYTSALAAQGSRSFTVGQAAGGGSYTTGSTGQTLSNGSYYWRVKAIDNTALESSYSTANSGSVAFIVDTSSQPVDWPMAGANPQRTSWTSETLPGNIATVWVKPIEPYVSQHVQVIGAGGNVYVATAKGLYAFDASSGTEAWVYPTELPLGHSPTYSSGVLYVGGLDKKLHAVNTTTGAGIWTYEATGGFSTSPVVANGMVYAGNRDGWFYAINTSDGSLAWKYQTGNQILQSAAYKAENDGIGSTSQGTLFFASNDGYAYALNAQTGALVWKSGSKLPSNGFYSWWPVIYENDVIFTRTTFGSGGTGEETDHLMCPPPVFPAVRPTGCIPSNTSTPGALGTVAGGWVTGTATQDLNNNSNGITFANYFETFPEYRNHIYYVMATGAERNFDIDGDTITDAAPVGWAGDGGNPSPPIVSGYDNVIYFRTYTRGGGGFGSKTIAGWDVGTAIISVPFSNTTGQSGSWPGDEPNGMTAAGNKIYWNHCCDRYVGAVDISQPNTDFLLTSDDANRQWRYVTSGGLPFTPFTNIGVPSNYYTEAIKYFWDPPSAAVFWNENDKVGPSAYDGKLYAILGNALVAFGSGGAGSSAPMLSSAAEETAPVSTSSITPSQLTARLELQVQAIVDAGHLKPSYLHSGGISSYQSRNIDDYLDHYWHNPADTHLILLRALPFLSTGLQIQVKTYLQDELASYSPATYAHMGFVSGAQRDPYPYPPTESDFNSFTIPALDKQVSSNFNNFWAFPPANVYALWKYAEAGLGNASTLLTAWGSTKLKVPIEDNFTTVNGQAINSGNIRAFLKSFPLVSNGFIAGYKGYVELSILAGVSPAVYGPYETELNKLLGWKVDDLLTFPDPQEPYVCENECYYESLITYYNFAYLTPILADYLKDNAVSNDPDKDILTIIQEYQDIAPYWMAAHNGETQGESAIQPYQQTHSLFQALAQVKGATYDELIKYLDTPIVPVGDLYYIDNVVATLEAPNPSQTQSPASTTTSIGLSLSSGSSGVSVCNDSSPIGADPWLYEANSETSRSIKIRFVNQQTPVDHFALEYGTEPGKYTFGLSSFGNKDTNEFSINSLSPDTTYYFRVRAGNGCATGPWSNELSAKTLGLFEKSTIVTKDFKLESKSSDNRCTTYEVKSGDNLWNIAKNILGSGDHYTQIIELNAETYPSLKSLNNISIGWVLKIHCEDTVETKADGYNVSIKVIDANQRPIEGAVVTLHSDPKTAKTDKDGLARFNDIEGGDHKVTIAYNGYEGEQSINLTGKVKAVELKITVERKNILLDRRVFLMSSVFTLIILILSILLLKAYKKNNTF
ncbi:MAG: hypothetical protein UT40_C0027G0003 [Candidatus Woesebacteria bacterium GW2011_GWA1_39_21b]|uniref:Uncharacterized protein n=3 Tax=Candidatus Woeseibacteriota TaxID=1752722 RepID=A0A0G0NAC8_9BACT|nr:MAG: hypothetical protein UT40_C0027G0003 [Candidatus Woesebacteria bacterium GW2011_GWA1_39_21b]KKT32779.1 MAG: hypothetical protein UW20_C0009G0015 [Candidatus Woesebacteria bacterium GW2011_GWB1_44_11]OGM76454.1 MAG: hypothetical protein A2208_00750 [Candidatus Woesebacteria bacterium RIFOXYA1_FULL_43_16]OGM82449.1 MAG: hypothetical protein A2394_02020 [Candidatus Woesebacteria bacterium RIFOXYB1_FULL_42_36]OGM84049.1 MAG: hypothetical protein A2421_00555 [Candidatus Woesebacteria bacteri